MLKIKISKISSYSFTGYVWADELTDDQAAKLGLTLQDLESNKEIEVLGEFVLEWDDDIPMPQIESVCLVGKQIGTTHGPTGQTETYIDSHGLTVYKPVWGEVSTHETLDLNQDDYNHDDILSEIEASDCGTWHEDRLGSLADYYHDQDR